MRLGLGLRLSDAVPSDLITDHKNMYVSVDIFYKHNSILSTLVMFFCHRHCLV